MGGIIPSHPNNQQVKEILKYEQRAEKKTGKRESES